MSDGPKRFCVVRKWKDGGEDGGEEVVDYFSSQEDAIEFILQSREPTEGRFTWCVGEWGTP